MKVKIPKFIIFLFVICIIFLAKKIPHKKPTEENETRRDLRQLIFSLSNSEESKKLSENDLIAVIQDMTFENGEGSTLVTVNDGTTSIYLSNGGGVVGLGEHPEIKKETLNFISFAKNYLYLATETKNFSLPQNEGFIFYFVMPGKVLATKEVALRDLNASDGHPLLSLFIQSQGILSAIANTNTGKEN